MLDLGFVRDHLPLVEEKLRQRGMVPAAILKDFHAIDLERRAAITQAETLKAQRNKATEEIAKLKKDKLDATALINETKQLREKISEAEKHAEESDAKLRNILTGIPNLPYDSVPLGRSEAGAGADELHARPAHARAWLHGSAAAVPGQRAVDVRHRPVAEVRSGSVQGAAIQVRAAG